MRFVLLFFMAAWGLAAQEIMLNNGEKYTDATVLHSDRVGIFIRGWRNGAFTLRFIPYNKLSPESYQQLADSDSSIGGPAVRMIHREISRIIKAEQEIQRTGDSSLWSHYFMLPGLPHNITLTSDEIFGNGTVGYAVQGAFSTGIFNYGRIYVSNLFIPQGNSWYGIVYPTRRVVFYYGSALPCCTLNPASALRLNENGGQGQ